MAASSVTTDLDRLLEQFPMSEELVAAGPVRHRVWSHQVSCSPATLWERVSDTERLNRALGLGAFAIEEEGDVMRGTTVLGGRKHEWIELPWDWEVGRSLLALRIYRKGWLRAMRILMFFEESNGGTKISILISWVPSGPLGRLIMGAAIAAMPSRYGAAMEALANEGHEHPSFHVRPPPIPRELDDRLAEITRQLAERVDPALAELLTTLVREGDDFDLDRVQPLRWARVWGRDSREVIAAFLHATRLGLFELGWDVICPHCRGPRTTVGDLSDLPSAGSCGVCHVDFRTDRDHSIEISFRVHPAIRVVPELVYCAMETKQKHIKVQWSVDAGSHRQVYPLLSPGRYRVRLHGESEPLAFLDVSATAEVAEVELSLDSDGEVQCRPSPAIVLANGSAEARTFIIEDTHWSDDALTPATLFSMQAFRDLFSEQYIESDIKLSVGRQTILFTDIVGSTRFYAEEGDPAAFAAVRAHFEVITGIVADHRGAVVKTIGDAVMAAFPNAVDAVAAGAAIHRALENRDGPIKVRASVHAGPCIAVNWNSGIDYFGSTVNIAAKLQACADAREVAMSETVYRAARVGSLLEERGADCAEEVLTIKALNQTLPVFRWKVDCSSSA